MLASRRRGGGNRGVAQRSQTLEIREEGPNTRNRNISNYGNLTILLVLKLQTLASPAASLADPRRFSSMLLSGYFRLRASGKNTRNRSACLHELCWAATAACVETQGKGSSGARSLLHRPRGIGDVRSDTRNGSDCGIPMKLLVWRSPPGRSLNPRVFQCNFSDISNCAIENKTPRNWSALIPRTVIACKECCMETRGRGVRRVRRCRLAPTSRDSRSYLRYS